MSRKRYTPEQIISMLREAEVALAQGQSIGQAYRTLGVSEQSYYRWRKEYGGLGTDQACPSSKHSGRLSLLRNGGSGSSWIDVKPLCVDGSSGGFGLSVSLSFPSFR